MSNLAKYSTAQDHKSRRKSGSVVCPLLSKGNQRGVMSLVKGRGQLVMSGCALFVLYYVRFYQLGPLSLIYNSFVYGKSSPVFTAQDTIKWVLLLHTPSICHPVILKEVFLQCNFLHISKFFLLLLMQPVTDVVIVGLFGHCTTRSLLIRCFCPDSEPRRAKITLNTVCHDLYSRKLRFFFLFAMFPRVTSKHFFFSV